MQLFVLQVENDNCFNFLSVLFDCPLELWKEMDLISYTVPGLVTTENFSNVVHKFQFVTGLKEVQFSSWYQSL